MKATSLSALTLGFLLVIVSACSSGKGTANGGETQKQPPTPPKDPVEITFYQTSSGFGEALFDKTYGNAIREKFPQYKIKFIPVTPETTIPNLIAAKAKIDIYSSTAWGSQTYYFPNGIEYDMSGLIQQNKVDLSRFEPTTINQIKQVSGGKMYGLPVGNSSPFLLYNRDLFDKFGVPYPTDNMTWDELYELSKRMTRKEGDVQYQGFASSFFQLLATNQLSVPFVDPNTEKTTYVSDDRWKKIIENIVRFYRVPGNEVDDNSVKEAGQDKVFFVDRKAAMYPTVTSPELIQVDDHKFWDMARLPSFAELPNVGPQSYPTYMFLTNMSERQKEAFEIIQYLVSDEFQERVTKIPPPYVTPLKNENIRKQFAKDAAPYKGKNIMARFPIKYADHAPMTPYSDKSGGILRDHLRSIVLGKEDVNSALRASAEEADKAIQAAKAAAGKK